MSKEIKVKCWTYFFDEIDIGLKDFEVRLGNLQAEIGDILIIEEYDVLRNRLTGRTIHKEIKYIVDTRGLPFWSSNLTNEWGYKIMSFVI